MARTRNTVETVFIGKDRTSDDIKRIQKNLASLQTQTKKFGQLMAGAAGLGGGVFAVQQLAQGFGNLVNEMDEVVKMSAQLGTSTEWLSEMQHGARLANIRVQEFNIGLQRMGRRAAQAAEGTGEAVDALERLGVELKVGDRLATIEELLPQIADGMSGVTDQTERLALAQKIFDSEGVKMLRILDEGAEGLRRLREEAAATGATLGSETAKDIERFSDEIENMKAQWRGVVLAMIDVQRHPLFKTLVGVTTALTNPGALLLARAQTHRLQDTTTATGGAVGFDPRAAEKAFPTPDMVSDTVLETELLEEETRKLLGTYSDLAIQTAEWGELGGRSIRMISQDVGDLGFTAAGTGQMMVVAAEESRDAFGAMLPVLDSIIDKLFEAGDAGSFFGDAIKGAAAGFVTGGPLGAVIGAGLPVVDEVFGREGRA